MPDEFNAEGIFKRIFKAYFMEIVFGTLHNKWDDYPPGPLRGDIWVNKRHKVTLVLDLLFLDLWRFFFQFLTFFCLWIYWCFGVKLSNRNIFDMVCIACDIRGLCSFQNSERSHGWRSGWSVGCSALFHVFDFPHGKNICKGVFSVPTVCVWKYKCLKTHP